MTRVNFIRAKTTFRAGRVGECIYCGSKNGLSDEHVVPLALGGTFVLQDASCQDCSAITSAFERKLARGFMQSARIVGGFPTRRPRERPKSVPLTVKRGDITEDVALPLDQALAFLTLPTFRTPALLDGSPRQRGVVVTGYETIHFGKEPSELHKTLGAQSIQVTVDWDVTSYARLIAKVAYGFAVGVHGLMLREEIPILRLILGQADDASVWLGSMPFASPLEQERPTHTVTTEWVGDPERTDANMFVAKVKLFCNSGASGMGVVVWRPQAADSRVPR